jgi:hypothetical protein
MDTNGLVKQFSELRHKPLFPLESETRGRFFRWHRKYCSKKGKSPRCINTLADWGTYRLAPNIIKLDFAYEGSRRSLAKSFVIRILSPHLLF